VAGTVVVGAALVDDDDDEEELDAAVVGAGVLAGPLALLPLPHAAARTARATRPVARRKDDVLITKLTQSS
jgi:hypothetical protein